jgi:tetratricopeptide (TPR) repeat protein
MILFVLIICSWSSPGLFSQNNLPDIVKKVKPSTVVVFTYDNAGKPLGQGSGFIISKEGDVITNRHVIKGATRAEIKTIEGNKYIVNYVLAEDKEGDLIRLSTNIPINTIRPLPLSNSIPAEGERIIVIGSPLGFEQTISDGIVSAIREMPGYGYIIQITAPISPGSSGSPVINMKGEVVGVATLRIIDGQNLNFAVSKDRVAILLANKKQSLSERQAGMVEGNLVSADDSFNIGVGYYWKSDYEKALYYFREAIKKNPLDAEAYLQTGLCYHYLSRYTEAVEACKQAIRYKPDYAQAYGALGVNYQKIGLRFEAIEAYRHAAKLMPENEKLQSLIGIQCMFLKRYAEAAEAFKQAIRIKPDWAEAYFTLGVSYKAQGYYVLAKEAYIEAIRIKPDFDMAHYDLGITYIITGEIQLALNEYEILKKLNINLANELFNTIYKKTKMERADRRRRL